MAGSKVYSLPDCNKMQKVDDDFQLQVEFYTKVMCHGHGHDARQYQKKCFMYINFFCCIASYIAGVSITLVISGL